MFRAITFASILTLSSAAASADSLSEHRQESSGLIGGAAIGAAIAGPPGAVAGGILGAFIGDGIAANARAASLQASLERTRRELYAIEQERRDWQNRYELAQQENAQPAMMAVSSSLSLPAPHCCGEAIALHFRSGSSTIEEHYREQLAELAGQEHLAPGTYIEITGYADRRGDPEQNQQLSRERAESVRSLLTEMGVDADRIRTLAFGENRPLQEAQDVEGDFFDRRVVIRLSDDNSAMLSQSTN